MTNRLARVLAALALLLAAACGAPPAPDVADQRDIAALTRELISLGPEIDPAEAGRMARISIEYALHLREAYGVTDPPLVHNTKVNMGLRPRGLCYQWADDLEARLRQEGFETFAFHRAIANSHTRLLIDHSVLIVSRRGDDMYAGVVLDGWRNGGDLFWSRTTEDERYDWVPREIVFARRAALPR